jgi:hypothetical protein
MKRTQFIILLICFMVSSCKKDFGTPVTEIRPAGPIRKIILDHKINLTLVQDNFENIYVKAGSKSIHSVSTEIKDSVLTILNLDNSSINAPGNEIELFVGVTNLEMIEYRGSGTLKSMNTLKPTSFTIVSSKGAGIVDLSVETGHFVAGIYEENADFIFRGKANSAYVYCASRGTIDMKDMEVKKMNIVYCSVRNGYVWVTDSLTGTVYHTGNVFYKGAPIRQTEDKSSGKFLSY